MDTKPKPIYILPIGDPLQTQRHIKTENERAEKDIPCEWKPKEAGVMILISDKIDFKILIVTRDKEGHYITIKGCILEEDRAIANFYAPNTGAP